MELSEIFAPFYEKTEEELLVEQAEAIMARTKVALPGYNPILFRESYREEDRPIMDAYRELILRNDPNSTSITNDSAQSQSVIPPTQPMAVPPFSQPYAAAPFVAPYALYTKPILQLAKKVERKSIGNGKFTPVEATEVLLSRVIVRYFDQKFYFFDGLVFQSLSDNEVGSFVHRYLYELVQLDGGPQLIKNVVALLRTHPLTQVFKTTDHPDRLYFLNGVLEISTGDFRPVDPRVDFFTAYVSVAYPQQPVGCPTMDAFLNTIFGGNAVLIETTWQALGYLLTCDHSAKCFVVLVGEGNTGKSVFCSFVDCLFSPGSASYCTPDQLTGRFGAHVLRGCHINICAELPYGKIGYEFMGLLKGITGNDKRMTEQKFRDPQQLESICKFLFASNFDLQIAGADEAFWDRAVVLPFLYPIPPEQQDKHLLDKLLAEAPAIVMKAIDAFRRLRANNYVFPIGRGNAQQVNGVFRHVSDAETVTEFINKCCEFASDFFTPTAQLYAAYIGFCAQHQYPAFANSALFSRKLNGLCGDRISNSKQRVLGQPTNGYKGIRVKVGGLA